MKTIGMLAVSDFCRQSRDRAAACNEDRDRALNQFRGQRRQARGLVICPAIFDCYILALDIAGFLQALPKRIDQRHVGSSRCAMEEADHRRSRLLGPRRKRPCCRKESNPSNEIAPSHLPARGCQRTDYIRYSQPQEGVFGAQFAPQKAADGSSDGGLQILPPPVGELLTPAPPCVDRANDRSGSPADRHPCFRLRAGRLRRGFPR